MIAVFFLEDKMSTIINLSDRRKLKAETEEYDNSGTAGLLVISDSSLATKVTYDHEYKPVGNIPTEDLYPLSSELNKELATASQLLEEGSEILNEAYNLIIQDEVFKSDDAIIRFQAILPELFCCRKIGDGFGVIINAIFHSLKNIDGSPINKEQIKAIRDLIIRLSSELYIDFDEAIEGIISLEDAGLELEPAHFAFAADLLND